MNLRDFEQFWPKVEFTDSCWLWRGAVSSGGYGNFTVGGRTAKAHRVAFQLAGGVLNSALELDHLCRVRLCVRPSHLEQVTAQVNQLRGDTVSARRAAVTHCPQGHEYSDWNTTRDRKGRRYCRTCKKNRYLAARRPCELGCGRLVNSRATRCHSCAQRARYA